MLLSSDRAQSDDPKTSSRSLPFEVNTNLLAPRTKGRSILAHGHVTRSSQSAVAYRSRSTVSAPPI